MRRRALTMELRETLRAAGRKGKGRKQPRSWKRNTDPCHASHRRRAALFRADPLARTVRTVQPAEGRWHLTPKSARQILGWIRQCGKSRGWLLRPDGRARVWREDPSRLEIRRYHAGRWPWRPIRHIGTSLDEAAAVALLAAPPTRKGAEKIFGPVTRGNFGKGDLGWRAPLHEYIDCSDCGRTFERRSNAQVRCDACRRQKINTYKREWLRTRKTHGGAA